MQKYIVGIDTGGTYTDAVLISCSDNRIVATAKTPTTHHQLSLSTGEALATLIQRADIAPEAITSLAVSSTLATNSVVENKGARVALLVVGYVRHFRLPVKAVVYIKGGHTITGEEEEPLDLDYLVEIVQGLKGEVDAYGVCSAMSIKNPAHELVAEKAISLIDPKPVFCSHRTSDIAGMKERAATAGLHAKLMPVMEEYIQGVLEAMHHMQLNCPVSIISGNGTTISAENAIRFAGATVASGPACTAHFGALHTSEDTLVIDVGGTTTDIAMIKNGQPLLAKEGCQIGGWRTHVEAVDMVTGGIGGDSFASVDEKGKIILGPTRVVPLSMAGEIPQLAHWLAPGEASRLIIPRKNKLTGEKAEEESIRNYLLEHGPATLLDLKKGTGLAGVPLEKHLERMASLQQVYECGFTPTDALHVLGRIDIGNRKIAEEGAKILGAQLQLTPKEFSERIITMASETIENLIIDYVIQSYWGSSLANFLNERNAHPVLGVNFTLKIPMIGIGAAARELLPEVAKRLGTTISFPEHGDVGNAVGAAILGAGQSGK